MDRWKQRAAKERQWKAKMLADVEFKLGYVKPFLGAFPLADVLPDHVDHMIDALGRDLADNTVRQIRNYLYQVFQSAVNRRYITYNPVIKPERRKRPKQKEPQRLSASQAALLIRAAAASFYALAWWLIVVLGMRAGEICGLRWGDVDLERCEIFIRPLVPLFHAQRQSVVHRAAQGMRRGYWQEHGLVFPGRAGRPMNPTSLRHMLKDLTDACALPPVTTHNLRHTAAKLYTDIATPHDVKQAILGHTPDITGHYGPPDPDAQRPWVERVYQALAGEITKLAAQAS
jgi:integrase